MAPKRQHKYKQWSIQQGLENHIQEKLALKANDDDVQIVGTKTVRGATPKATRPPASDMPPVPRALTQPRIRAPKPAPAPIAVPRSITVGTQNPPRPALRVSPQSSPVSQSSPRPIPVRVATTVSEEQTPKRRRGRPPGSKSKPKPIAIPVPGPNSVLLPKPATPQAVPSPDGGPTPKAVRVIIQRPAKPAGPPQVVKASFALRMPPKQPRPVDRIDLQQPNALDELFKQQLREFYSSTRGVFI